jgi:hypothetical protein
MCIQKEGPALRGAVTLQTQSADRPICNKQHSQRVGDKQAATDLELLIDQLEVMADWRAELATKLKRAQLKGEVIGLDEREQCELEHEVHEFNLLCRELANLISEVAA